MPIKIGTSLPPTTDTPGVTPVFQRMESNPKMTRKPAEEFTLTLRANQDGERPAIVRIRMLLKYALRALGLKCVGLASPNGTEISPGRDRDQAAATEPDATINNPEQNE